MTWTPREFFITVYTDIIANGLQLQCAPLINWMCAICTAWNNNKAISSAGHVLLSVPLANAILMEHCLQLVICLDRCSMSEL